ncbi:hypothetical protein NMY22_g3338 [Coprinellus aureogranulatus]|nr:hypothetical protein NMY22_g3338 [Coprinellus aureogranulatus]
MRHNTYTLPLTSITPFLTSHVDAHPSRRSPPPPRSAPAKKTGILGKGRMPVPLHTSLTSPFASSPTPYSHITAPPTSFSPHSSLPPSSSLSSSSPSARTHHPTLSMSTSTSTTSMSTMPGANNNAAALPYPALYLYPLNDSFVPKHIALSHGQHVKIGRQTNAKTAPGERNGYFDSKVLSRQHAEVWEEGGKIFIKDVKSSNGTFINGDRLSSEAVESEPCELKSDDILRLIQDTTTIALHLTADRRPPHSNQRGIPRPDGRGRDGTAAAQFIFLQSRKETLDLARSESRRRRASVPIPPRYDTGVDSDGAGTGEDVRSKLSKLIHEISDPHSSTYTRPPPQPLAPSRKQTRRESLPVLSTPVVQTQARAHPRLIFDALSKVAHVGGREEVEKVLDLHEWMRVWECDELDREEREALSLHDTLSRSDEVPKSLFALSTGADKDLSTQVGEEGACDGRWKAYERKKVFGVPLRHVSVYASTSVLLSSSSPSPSPSSASSALLTSLTSSSASTLKNPDTRTDKPSVEGHTLSLPIVLVSTIEELYRTGLYTPSLFRTLPDPMRLRELVSVFDHYDLGMCKDSNGDAVIVTPRPTSPRTRTEHPVRRERKLAFGGCRRGGERPEYVDWCCPGGVVGVGAYLRSSSNERGRGIGERGRGKREKRESGSRGWCEAVWEWCRVYEDDLGPGSETTSAPYDTPVSEETKIHTAQLLLHLLPSPAFDALVYILAFFSQVVLVQRVNGVGIEDVGALFGRGVFGSFVGGGSGSGSERQGQRSGDRSGKGRRTREGADMGADEDKGAKMMCWFLRRWDRISRGLFDVPRRLREEAERPLPLTAEENRARVEGVDASSTYSYSEESLGSSEVGEKREEVRGVRGAAQMKMEVDPDVHIIPLPLAQSAKAHTVQTSDIRSDSAGRRKGASLESERRHRNITSPSTTPSSLEPGPSPRPSHQASTRGDSESLCLHTDRNSGPNARGHCLASLESTSQHFFEDREVANSPTEYDEGEGLDLGSSCVPLSLLESEVLQVTGTGEEMELRERTGTESTLESVDAEERVLMPKAAVSVDEMLDEMLSKSYELVSEEPVLPSTHGEKTILSSEALLPSNSSANVALVEGPSPVRPLHLKPKYTAQSLLDELRRETSTDDCEENAEKSVMVVETPVMQMYRTPSVADQGVGVVEARLYVAMEDEDELHVHFGSELGEESIERRQSTLKPIDHPLLEDDSSEDSASHNTDLVDDHQPTLKPPERSNTYELEVELRRLKEQNKQAMYALEEATRQIHNLEEKLAGVEVDE